jgi:hypothetical protein
MAVKIKKLPIGEMTSRAGKLGRILEEEFDKISDGEPCSFSRINFALDSLKIFVYPLQVYEFYLDVFNAVSHNGKQVIYIDRP